MKRKIFHYKKILLFFCAVLCVGLFACALTGCRYRYSRETDPEKYLSFELLEDGTYTVLGYKDRKTRNLVIPATYQGIPVTQISENAFYEEPYWNPWRDAVKTLTIEDGIKHIGDGAFTYCAFERVSLPDSIETVGANAFEEVFASFPLPKNIKGIGVCAFENSGLYGDLDLDGITCETGAFRGTQIASVSLSYESVPNSLFSGSRLTSVVLKEGVQYIEDHAFSVCSLLKEIEFPASLIKINECAFYASGLEEVYLPSHIIGVGREAFGDCTSLQKATLSHSADLTDYAFEGCSALDELVLSNYPHYIDPDSFRYCPLGVMRIEGDCGQWVVKEDCLTKSNDETEIILGGSNAKFTSFSKIGAYAFSGRQLYDIKIGENIEEIEEKAFYSAVIQSAEISSQKVGGKAFYYARFGYLSVSSKRICSRAFEYAYIDDGIARIEEGCEVIEKYAFVSCSSITTAYLPASLQEIGELAFGYCPYLTSVYYAYEGDTPAYMSSATFCGNQVVWEGGGRYREWRMAEGFKIYVKAEIYAYCKNNWTDTPTVNYDYQQTYVFLDRLCDFVYLYRD